MNSVTLASGTMHRPLLCEVGGIKKEFISS